MKITIRDIARIAGVSTTTVSFVINNKDARIPQETRDKVMRVVQEYNYHQNKSAVSLVSKSSRIIGLIIPDISNEFFAKVVKIIEKISLKMNYTVIVGSTSDDENIELNYVRSMISYNVDGLLIVKSPIKSKGILKQFNESIGQSAIPVVFIDRFIKDMEYIVRATDNVYGGYIATKYLIEKGMKMIACITGDRTVNSTIDRLKGYKKAISEQGIAFDESLVFEGNYMYDSGYRIAKKILDKKCDGAFIFNDMMAAGFYKYCAENGHSVKEDISLVGYDNSIFAEILHPQLTSVSQPIDEICNSALEALIESINKNLINEKVKKYKPKLIIRDSVK